ncbi:MAG: TIGR04211 family SH3 domain-containing protein [Gammaproteobacteria bacterium]|nr:TIGR04211 family SH3 domain-containing protein [Gammaproteobacteria bacterium]
MFYKQTRSIRYSVVSLFFLLFVTFSMPAQAKTSYVSDELKVPLRSGASNGHRIIKFLKSGTALTVLAASDDNKFVEVEVAGGKTGWVATEDVMDVPSGRDRLAFANKKSAKMRQENKDLKNSIAKLKSEIRQLTNEKGSLQSERTNLSNSLEDLKITAANPLSLSKKNKQLKKDLDKAKDRASMLDKDNQQLRSNVAQEWFMIGGAVSLGSLIVGLILTRINWRKKRDSWGDSF